jgi:inosine-uridine nucleoside N-ribohydrolase
MLKSRRIFKMSLSRRFIPFLLALGAGAAPVPIIFDTDMGNDIDDALALAMLHGLESRGEVKIAAVTLTKDNRYAAEFVDLVNQFYGRGAIPVGRVRIGKTPEDSDMIKVPAQRRDKNSRFVYPRSLVDGSRAADAALVLRQALEKQPDGSVIIVQVGFSTNLARLLMMPGGSELAARKVKLLSMMAGQFPTGKPEYNVKTDLDAARMVFEKWPGPIVVSGFEIGAAIKYPAQSIENDFRYVANHPVAEAYRNYQKMPYDRETWDLTSVLYAVRPNRGYFGLSQPGTIKVDGEGKTRLELSPNGRHRHLTVDATQKVRVLEALVYLASQPPGIN